MVELKRLRIPLLLHMVRLCVRCANFLYEIERPLKDEKIIRTLVRGNLAYYGVHTPCAFCFTTFPPSPSINILLGFSELCYCFYKYINSSS